jgi:hypothetical protein
LIERLARHDAWVTFVSLTAPEGVIEGRVANESRRRHQKMVDPGRYRQLRDSGAFRYPGLPVDLLVDTSVYSPAQSAQLIVKALDLPSFPDHAGPRRG